jgi:predicted lactoylglutathione lyase
MKFEFPAAVPEIPVSDFERSAAYYQNNLGFTLDWGPGDHGLAGISRGECRMFLSNEGFRSYFGNTSGPVLIWLNLNSKDEVDELYDEWSNSGVELVSEPKSKEYGLHEFIAKDPDGNMFRVFYDFSPTGG